MPLNPRSLFTRQRFLIRITANSITTSRWPSIPSRLENSQKRPAIVVPGSSILQPIWFLMGPKEIIRKQILLLPKVIMEKPNIWVSWKSRTFAATTSSLRLSILYGRGNGFRQCFFEKLEQQALRGDRANLFVDQFRSPLYIGDAVEAITRLASSKDQKGLFHLGGPERMSRFEFGESFCTICDFPQTLLVPSEIEQSQAAGASPQGLFPSGHQTSKSD